MEHARMRVLVAAPRGSPSSCNFLERLFHPNPGRSLTSRRVEISNPGAPPVETQRLVDLPPRSINEHHTRVVLFAPRPHSRWTSLPGCVRST